VKRSPLVLVVVGFVVALMLYFGYHQARHGVSSAPRITLSTVAPDFSLESLDGKTMRLSDLLGKDSVGDEYGGVNALPQSFLIARDGKVVDKIVGLRGKSEIEDAIKKALNTRPAASQASSLENTAASEPQR